MDSRKRIILIVLAIVIIIIPLAWFLTGQGSSEDSDTLVDRDTGEELLLETINLDTGASINASTTRVLGLTNLAEEADSKDIGGGYISTLREGIGKYGDTRLNNEYQTLTVRPQSLKFSSTVIRGEIRLGQTDEIVPFSIRITQDKTSGILYINESGETHDGTFVYVGGIENNNRQLYDIRQENDTSAKIIIDTYAGYREAAMNYLESIGYNIPDLEISFTNYESPF